MRRDSLLYVVELARERLLRGGSYDSVEVYAESMTSSLLRVYSDHRVERLGTSTVGLAIRAACSGQTRFAYSTDLTPRGLGELLSSIGCSPRTLPADAAVLSTCRPEGLSISPERLVAIRDTAAPAE